MVGGSKQRTCGLERVCCLVVDRSAALSDVVIPLRQFNMPSTFVVRASTWRAPANLPNRHRGPSTNIDFFNTSRRELVDCGGKLFGGWHNKMIRCPHPSIKMIPVLFWVCGFVWWVGLAGSGG